MVIRRKGYIVNTGLDFGLGWTLDWAGLWTGLWALAFDIFMGFFPRFSHVFRVFRMF